MEGFVFTVFRGLGEEATVFYFDCFTLCFVIQEFLNKSNLSDGNRGPCPPPTMCNIYAILAAISVQIIIRIVHSPPSPVSKF